MLTFYAASHMSPSSSRTYLIPHVLCIEAVCIETALMWVCDLTVLWLQ